MRRRLFSRGSLFSKSNFARYNFLFFSIILGLIGGYIVWRGIGASPNPNLPGDINNDNIVDIKDLSILLANYGTTNANADLNSDGVVNVFDLSVLLSHYNQTLATGTAWPGNPYTLGSIWNPGHVIPANISVDPSSSSIISYWLAHRGSVTTFDLSRWAVATAIVRAGTPTYNISGCSYTCSYNRFGPVPIPVGTNPDPGGDGHLAILDLQNGREWDLYQASFNGSTWSASCGDGLLLSEVSVPSNICGAVDANFPAAAGIVQPEEIKAGLIRHPLVFATTTRGPGQPHCPATHESSNDPASPVVNGIWLQLDPTLDVNTLSVTWWEKIIAKALQDYGMFLRDGSGTNDIYGENTLNRDPNAWTNAGLTPNQYGAVEFSGGFPWNRMRVLSAPC